VWITFGVRQMSFLKRMRPVLKRILPRTARQAIHQWNINRADAQFANVGRGELFDGIYRNGMWSNGEARQMSGPGSYSDSVSDYVSVVIEFIRTKQITTLLDIGCGDFHIGEQICGAVPQYIGADVSAYVINRNRDCFGGLENVKFLQLDACVQDLPAADLITIREVLQHLSNAEVEATLANIERSSARYVLVTEHLPAETELRAPNLDKPHGPNVRNPFGSGVFIDLPPFNRSAEMLLAVRHPLYAGAPSHLVTHLWQPNFRSS
jgi:SAM-dependent methyltransferase